MPRKTAQGDGVQTVETQNLTIRVPVDLLAALRKLADDQDRTLTAEVLRRLRATVEADADGRVFPVSIR